MKMKIKSELVFVVLIVSVTLSCLPPSVLSANYAFVYELLDRPSGSTHYRLNIVVSESLLEYYVEKSHVLISENDFAMFITPHALKPIADCLREIYSDDEDFANGVLMIVHQIPYDKTKPSKYPVETIAANKGDCDLFSYIAASIMKAGGLDVVLFYYESEEHMNIGVNLSHEPRGARGEIDYVLHDGIRYYMAECTGENWKEGWRVGECPDDLTNATVQVVTLENCEQSAPGQVTASYSALAVSTVSLGISSGFLTQGSSLTLSGQLSQPLQNTTITIYIKANGLPWSELGTASTDSRGCFAYVWLSDVSGVCYLRASWSGNENYAAGDSPTRTVTVLSWFFIALLSMTVVLVSVGTVVFLVSRHAGSEPSEPQPPEISS